MHLLGLGSPTAMACLQQLGLPLFEAAGSGIAVDGTSQPLGLATAAAGSEFFGPTALLHWQWMRLYSGPTAAAAAKTKPAAGVHGVVLLGVH